jgi:hypothetical protein
MRGIGPGLFHHHKKSITAMSEQKEVEKLDNTTVFAFNDDAEEDEEEEGKVVKKPLFKRAPRLSEILHSSFSIAKSFSAEAQKERTESDSTDGTYTPQSGLISRKQFFHTRSPSFSLLGVGVL